MPSPQGIQETADSAMRLQGEVLGAHLDPGLSSITEGVGVLDVGMGEPILSLVAVLVGSCTCKIMSRFIWLALFVRLLCTSEIIDTWSYHSGAVPCARSSAAEDNLWSMRSSCAAQPWL